MTSVKDQVHRLVGETPDAGDLYLLAELSQEFALSLDIEETLRNAVATIIGYLDAEAASVFLLEGQELVCRASAGPSPITGLRLPMAHGIVGRTLATGMCQMVRDVQADKDFNVSVDRSTGFTTRSIMCTPLQVRERPLGVLQVLNKQGNPGLFSEHDLYVLRVLGVAVSLAIHNARMAADLLEQKRIRQELELARELQQRLLPPARPAPFPLQGFNLSAYEVSGDFYDWFDLDDGRIGFTIGDVSGKGLNAALLMVRTTSLLRGLGRAEHTLPDLMRRVNAELCETTSHGMFVCALAGIYDPAAREARWCSAGFPAVLRHGADGRFERLPADSPPLGILAEIEFAERRLALNRDALYFYSDGAVEARGADGMMLDEPGLRELIAGQASLPPPARLAALMARLRGLQLRDDTTLLLLEDRGV
jgi:sigma-B regulation protein RsbU (phosphoserine phosphatase)